MIVIKVVGPTCLFIIAYACISTTLSVASIQKPLWL